MEIDYIPELHINYFLSRKEFLTPAFKDYTYEARKIKLFSYNLLPEKNIYVFT